VTSQQDVRGADPGEPTRRSVSDRDRGASFVEVVLAIVLISLVVLPLMATVRTAIKVSRTNEMTAIAETVVVDAADRVNRAPLACDYSVYVKAAVQIRGWSPSQATVVHEYYDTDTKDWAPGGCKLALPTERLVQRLTMTIQTPNEGPSRSVQVVKSNV
jgi:Flp pilus assembly pilin Flp